MIAIAIAMCLDVANIYFLVYWELEERVSIHHKDEIVEKKETYAKLNLANTGSRYTKEKSLPVVSKFFYVCT